MDARLLLWVSLVTGFLIPVVAAARAFRRPAPGRDTDTSPSPNPFSTFPARLALAVPFAGFLITLPSKGPIFEPGHGLGTGFLIGGIAAALLAALVLGRGASLGRDSGGSALALPVFAASAALLFERANLLDILFGEAIGWFAMALLLYPIFPRGKADNPDRDPAGALVLSTGVMATLAVACVLGTLRDERTLALDKGTWAAIAIAITALGAIIRQILTLLPVPSGEGGKRISPTPLIGIGLLALFALLVDKRMTAESHPLLFSVFITGLLLWPVVVWVHRSARPVEGESAFPLPFLPMLLLAGGFVLSGQLLLGYGSAIFTLGLWLSALLLWPVVRPGDGTKALSLEHAEVRLLLFGTALALFRGAEGRWGDDLRGAALLTDHYALFGFLAGLATPFVTRHASLRNPIARSVVAGAMTLVVPAAVIVLFGPKCVLPMLIGASLAPILGDSMLPALLAIGLGLAVDQLLGRALPLSELARGDRMKALGIITALAAAAVLGSGWAGAKFQGGTPDEER